MGAEGVEETLQTAVDPLIRNTVFKENNNLVLSGKDYLESFLVGALSVGALHAKSTAIGLSTDVVSSLYKMKNSKGQQLPSETVKAYLSNNVSEADIQKMDTWAKDVKAEDIDKMNDDINRIANVKIGGIAYGKIGKITAKMDSGKAIEFYHKIMNSPEYRAETESIKAYKAKGNDGDDNNIDYISSNPANPKGNPNDYAGSMQAAANPGDNGNNKAGYIRSNPDNPSINPNYIAGTEQASAYPDDNNGKFDNIGTMVANNAPDTKKPDDDIPMEKAANGYEYDAYENTDADSNNQNNKPLTIESRNDEGQGGGNDVDVYNKGTSDGGNDNYDNDMDNGGNNYTNADDYYGTDDVRGEAYDTAYAQEEDKENAINGENNIANDNNIRYKDNDWYKETVQQKLDYAAIKSNTNKSLIKQIEDEGIKFEDFVDMTNEDYLQNLTKENWKIARDTVRDIARKIGKPKVNTPLRKLYPISELNNLLKRKVLGGSVARAEHVSGLKTLDDVIYGMGMYFKGTKIHPSDKQYIALDTITTDNDKFEFPYYKTSKNTPFKKGYPFTTFCFISTNKAVIAEYTLIERDYNDGDKFYIIDSETGNKVSTYIYDFGEKRWIKEEDE